MATPYIFPSLTRAPGYDSSATIEDDTIRDSSEQGYVATRPRFTRARRTWKVNHRYLTAEDIRSLQWWTMSVAKRGAVAFYYPNLIQNWSFEAAADQGSGDLIDQWFTSAIPANVSLVSGAYDGQSAIQIAVSSGDYAGVNPILGGIASRVAVPVNVGDVYQVSYSASVSTPPIVAMNMQLLLVVTYQDGSTGNAVASGPLPATGAGFQQLAGLVTIPASPSGSPAVSAYLDLSLHLSGQAVAEFTAANAMRLLLDCVGLALVTQGQPSLQMAGSSPLVAPVRFTKLPESADLGWAGNEKRYGVAFELTEL